MCGIYANPSHPTDACPTLQQDDGHVFANQTATVANVFPVKTQYYQSQHQTGYDPWSSTYNPSWKDHLNFRYKAEP